ncbi:MAG: hypothetical protein GEU88_04540 [Solirubrobacterales bacterium]|nr:hypothetical protein [Solirubrobacterales bacterium]
MARRGRLVAAVALTLALGVAAIAYADGASQNQAFVEGSVKPKKLDKKKYKPIDLFTEVSTEGPVPGINPESELIEYDKDGKWDSKAAPTCSAPIEFLSTDAAKAACPKGSAIGSGEADIELPGGLEYKGLTVTAFNGPGKNEIRLHTYDPRLAGATPTVFGTIKNLKGGGKYGIALSVPDAPDVAGDTGMITRFGATISRKSGTSLARCKDKKFLIRRTVTFDDGSKSVAKDSSKCKRKKGGKGGK